MKAKIIVTKIDSSTLIQEFEIILGGLDSANLGYTLESAIFNDFKKWNKTSKEGDTLFRTYNYTIEVTKWVLLVLCTRLQGTKEGLKGVRIYEYINE